MSLLTRRPAVSIPIPSVFRSSERRTPERPCLNCGDPTPGNYCRNCGQRKVEVQVSLTRMLLEALDDQFSINSALPRSMGALLARPGHLTREYMGGRIARYIPPFRLYLVTSVVFFLALSLLPELRNPNLALNLEHNGAQVQGTRNPAVRIGGAAPATVQRPVAPVLPNGTRRVVMGVGAPPPAPVPPPVPHMRWLQGAHANTGDAVLDSIINARIAHFQRMEPGEALREVVSTFLSHVPQMMFLLLPIFALLLKLLYVKSGRFYVEHFVFALHLHSFCFVTFLAMIVARWQPLILFLGCWVMLYTLLAMKKVYGQGWLATLFKYGVLGIIYVGVVTTAASLTLMASVLLA